ncbi:anhydro-N-acetylmuramic acid kinase [Pseudooceanicola algae]|uniref:Anhydro-N-acetylmuramic acid kinase n=1 Tax=Pseudooceanicola algae TaxID=1537215 RepID=A0A418SEK4_9RHOB|nr:anhydro-N-acetylmuramic acid kinase [Pseudooceanicola algae]QPM89794.1 Anhydro-N-acetylmuramic acid kinase [Pseudooceanicola algae]
MSEAAETGRIMALGVMSGTSLDGVDAALVDTDGQQIFGFGRSAYLGYSEAEQAALSAALGLWPGEDARITAAHDVVLGAHATLMGEFPEAGVMGFHGQTLAHEPRGRGTFQLGDGAELARRLARPVVWDFRSADVAAGGEGAPLAPFFHHACARWCGADAPVAFLNMGGVGNLTWVDPGFEDPAADGALLAFDTGPANAPINDLLLARRGAGFDQDGALAASGVADEGVIAQIISHSYFSRVPPKSLDRNDFGDLSSACSHLSDADAAATLTGLAAEGVARGLRHLPARPERLLVTGGGRRNAALMKALDGRCGLPVAAVEAVGLDGDMLEAQAFAYLAVRVLKGLPISAPGTTGVPKPQTGGRISQPADLQSA